MNTYIHDPDLTAAESAAIDEGNAADAAATAAAAAASLPVQSPEPAATVIEPSAAETAAAQMSAAASQIAAAAERIATAQAPAASATAAAEVVVPVDYEAQLTALETKFDDGDLTQAEYRAEERRILRAQTEALVADRVKHEQQQAIAAQQQQNEATANAAWDSAQSKFFLDPGNASLIADPIKQAGFKAAIDVVFAEAKGQITYDDLLVKARERLTGVAAVDPAEAIRLAEFKRQQEAGGIAPQTLRDAPNAGNSDDAPGASLDNLDISSLEDKMFLMSDADRARYLADAPGGYRDNPRATS